MPILFALSILAFVALLWATISIAGFVRRQRRRRRGRASIGQNGFGPRQPGPPPPPHREASTAESVNSEQSAPGGTRMTPTSATFSFPPPPPLPRLRSFGKRVAKQAVEMDDAFPSRKAFSSDAALPSDVVANRYAAGIRARKRSSR